MLLFVPFQTSQLKKYSPHVVVIYSHLLCFIPPDHSQTNLGMDQISVHAPVLCVGGLLVSITRGDMVSRTTINTQVYHITACLLEHVMAEKGSSESAV